MIPNDDENDDEFSVKIGQTINEDDGRNITESVELANHWQMKWITS